MERRVLELCEWKPHEVEELSDEQARALWKNHREQVRVEPPSPLTQKRWILLATNWVGSLPVGTDLLLRIRPKVALANLFAMLDCAYGFDSLLRQAGVIEADSLEGFYDRLAGLLAHDILTRGRRGWLRAYVPRSDRSLYVRGRLDLNDVVRRPWEARRECHFEEHTADIEDNQLLAWTTERILRSGLTRGSRGIVARAHRALRGVTGRRFDANDCVGRRYHRLNLDYQPMHGLCRFFLEHSGPSLSSGESAMVPFLISMPRLFEQFVYGWLVGHLPPGLTLKPQEAVVIGESGEIRFDIDLVLYDRAGRALAVLDTKYKRADKVSNSDLSQVVTYAVTKRCRLAVLVYPERVTRPLTQTLGEIRVRTLAFSLDGDLEACGQEFMERLLGELRACP